MAKALKKPRLVDTVRYGEELATLKRNRPKQWQRLKAVAKSRGVTIPSLVSGAPPALQEKTPAAIKREAAKTIAAAYAPEVATLNRRQRANEALAAKQASDSAAYEQWLDGQVGLLRAQAGAADTALANAHQKINDDLVRAQAATAADIAQNLAAARLTSDPSQSTALAAVPAAQAQANERQANARAHSAELQKIGATSQGVQQAALLATAGTMRAQDKAGQLKAAGELAADRTDLGLRRAASTAQLRSELAEANRAVAQGNREFGLAAKQLGIKQSEIAADLKKARLDYKLQKKEFNFKVWQEKNKVQAEKLKREIEYDKIASREGIAAADRALRQRAQAWDEAHPKGGAGGGSGQRTAAEKNKSQQLYNDIETARTLIIARQSKGKTERQIRLGLIKAGAPNTVIDIALDLVRNEGKLSPAGARKARNVGVLKPWELWPRYSGAAPPTQQHGGVAGP